jgi:uncharacterized membrane protein YhaH (DUF805 family)
MDFATAVRTCLNKYATFTGRAQRSELWWWTLFSIIANMVAVAIDASVLGMPAVQILVALGLILPGIAVGVRRLHDLDKSGWWYLIVFVPIVGALILIYFFIQRGTNGSNQFGPDPLA